MTLTNEIHTPEIADLYGKLVTELKEAVQKDPLAIQRFDPTWVHGGMFAANLEEIWIDIMQARGLQDCSWVEQVAPETRRICEWLLKEATDEPFSDRHQEVLLVAEFSGMLQETLLRMEVLGV